jgi:hypothetical protein
VAEKCDIAANQICEKIASTYLYQFAPVLHQYALIEAIASWVQVRDLWRKR